MLSDESDIFRRNALLLHWHATNLPCHHVTTLSHCQGVSGSPGIRDEEEQNKTR